MFKLILAIAISIGSGQLFGQTFTYSFKIQLVTDPGHAKIKIGQIRDLLGVKTVYFQDDLDQFRIKTHLDFEVEEMMSDFESIGLTVQGGVTKTSSQ